MSSLHVGNIISCYDDHISMIRDLKKGLHAYGESGRKEVALVWKGEINVSLGKYNKRKMKIKKYIIIIS